MNNRQLDLVFGALSDPTRRGMLAQLSQGETNISALAAPYDISQPAASKQIRVLERAGLIRRTKRGREYLIRVNPGAVEAAQSWISFYADFWKAHFDAVETYLEQQGCDRGDNGNQL